jgi:hypothetical protein
VELIWTQWAHTIFAPLYHFLYPQKKFPIRYQSPQEPLMHMMMLGHVYAAVKEELQTALLDPGMSKPNLSILQDLEFLCEFAIPVVKKIG